MENFKYGQKGVNIDFHRELFDYLDEDSHVASVLIKQKTTTYLMHLPKAYAYFKLNDHENYVS